MFFRVAAIIVFWALLIGCGGKKSLSQEDIISSPNTKGALDKKLDVFDEKPEQPHFIVAGVADKNAPNKTLLEEWGGKKNPSAKERLDRQAIQALLESTSVIDTTPYQLTDDLKNALLNSKNLKWLNIGDNATSSDLEWITEISGLRGLGLNGADLGNADLNLLSRLKDLEWIDLSYASLPNDVGEGLPEMPKLEVLWLRGIANADQFAPKTNQFPQLSVLCLGYTNLSDSGVNQIAASNPRLMFLDLFDTEVTPISIDGFVKFRDLRFLHLGQTPLQLQLGRSKGVDDFRGRMPKCDIKFGS